MSMTIYVNSETQKQNYNETKSKAYFMTFRSSCSTYYVSELKISWTRQMSLKIEF